MQNLCVLQRTFYRMKFNLTLLTQIALLLLVSSTVLAGKKNKKGRDKRGEEAPSDADRKAKSAVEQVNNMGASQKSTEGSSKVIKVPSGRRNASRKFRALAWGLDLGVTKLHIGGGDEQKSRTEVMKFKLQRKHEREYGPSGNDEKKASAQ